MITYLMNIFLNIILLHHGHHFWSEQTTLHTQEVNILLVRIFLVCPVRRLSDVTEVKCHSPLLPSLTSQLYSRKQFQHVALLCF